MYLIRFVMSIFKLFDTSRQMKLVTVFGMSPHETHHPQLQHFPLVSYLRPIVNYFFWFPARNDTILVFPSFIYISSHFQQGMPMFIIWAYHSTSDVQPGQFPKHSSPGVREVTLIPGTSVICNQFLAGCTQGVGL